MGNDKTLEAEVEAFFVRCIQLRGGVERKFQYPGRRGAADRIFALPMDGVPHMCELKRPSGGVYSIHQLEDHKEWAAVGVNVLKFHTKGQVMEWFQNYDREWDL